MKTLNEVYSSLAQRMRYEVWFLRVGLADGSGAWWFRYLLSNPGRGGCPAIHGASPVQVWATWFPWDGAPQSFIQGFSVEQLALSRRGDAKLDFTVGESHIDNDSCRGDLHVDGHEVFWDLRSRSSFRTTLSDKGWLGFSRTPHSNASFSGEIRLDGSSASGDALGYGVQGHNSGFRYRGFWSWMHGCFPAQEGEISSFEALVYELPLGFVFRRAVLWHEGRAWIFRRLRETTRDRKSLIWRFRAESEDGCRIDVEVGGQPHNIHRLPYTKTNCSGTFEVSNNSLATARIRMEFPGRRPEELATEFGAVVEMSGER